MFCLGSCGSNTSLDVPVEWQRIHGDLHLGEYLQITDAGDLITFDRTEGSKTRGLVSLSGADHQIALLDEGGAEGKDLWVSNREIAYRLDQNVVHLKGDVRQVYEWNIERLRGFWTTPRHILFAIQKNSAESELRCIASKDGSTLTESLPGRVLAGVLQDSTLWLISYSPHRLTLLSFECGKQIQTVSDWKVGSDTHYSTLYHQGDKIWIATMEEEEGALRVLNWNLKTKTLSKSQVVAGKAFESYTGMDARFVSRWPGTPDLLFLDGIKLKLHWAKAIGDSRWKEEALALPGAVGFYSQIVRATESEISFYTHAFRSLDATGKSHFEDLILGRMEISQAEDLKE